MSTPTEILVQKCDYWMRVVLSVELCVKEALIWILHNHHKDPTYNGLPDDKQQLYARMLAFKTSHKTLLKNVLHEDQWLVLCPASGMSNSKDWDITSLVVVIRYETTLCDPLGGWNQKQPLMMDCTKAAFCLRARGLRNIIKHCSITDISTEAQFRALWLKLEFVLKGLHFHNMVIFNDLETGSLKLYTMQITKCLEDKVSCLEQAVTDLEKNKVDLQAKKLSGIEDDMLDNINSINNLEISVKFDIQQITKLVSELETGKVKVNAHKIDKVKEEITEFMIDAVNSKNEISNLKAKMDKLSKMYLEHNESIEKISDAEKLLQNTLQEERYGVKKRIDNIEVQVQTMNGKSSKIEAEQYKMDKQLLDVKNGVDNIKQSSLKLESEQQGINAKVSDAQDSLADIKRDIQLETKTCARLELEQQRVEAALANVEIDIQHSHKSNTQLELGQHQITMQLADIEVNITGVADKLGMTMVDIPNEISKTSVSTMRKEFANENAHDLVLPEVILKTCAMIGDNWNRLAHLLGMTADNIEMITKKMVSNQQEEIMRECFRAMNDNVTWKNLKAQLLRTGETGKEILQALRDTTLLTAGLQDASNRLKKLHDGELRKWLMPQLFKDQDSKEVLRNDAYVNLAVITAADMDANWETSDRVFQLELRQFERKNIEMEQILTDVDDFVVIRGIAGIGKSTMVDMYVLKWANDFILTGDNDSPRIDFLFKFTCREINTLDVTSMKDLLVESYSTIFKEISLEDLEEISQRVLILVDGVDELQGIHSLHCTTKYLSAKVRSLRDLINPKSRLMSAHKTIVTGRPEATEIVKSVFSSRSIKCVEVCGFSPENVEMYVEKHFHDSKNRNIIEEVKAKIKESDNLNVMSTIPIYTWIICEIFQEDIHIESPKTSTHLFAYACLLFIRNHLKALENPDLIKRILDLRTMTLEELIGQSDILDIILCLAKLSKSTLQSRKVVFYEADITQFKTVIDLEQTGFIHKFPRGERKPMFQFRHLVLQEFLSSIYIYFHSRKMDVQLRKSCFKSCVPIVAGLYGISSSNTSGIIKTFLENMNQFIKSKIKWHHFLQRSLKESYDVRKHIEKMLELQMGDTYFQVNRDSSHILSAIFEYQGRLTDKFERSVATKDIHIENIIFHHDIRNTLHLLEIVNASHVKQIHLNNLENKTFPNNFLDMFYKFFGKERNDNVNSLELKKGSNFEIRADTSKRVLRKNVCITLPDKDTIEKHKALVASLLSHVDEVLLDYDLDDLYSHLKALVQEAEDGVSGRKIKLGNLPARLRSKRCYVAVSSVHIEMILDDYLHFSTEEEEMFTSLKFQQSQSLSLSIDSNETHENVISINFPNVTAAEKCKSVLESANPFLTRIMLDFSLDALYPYFKSLVDNSVISREKVSITGTPTTFSRVSWNEVEMILDKHFLYLDKDYKCINVLDLNAGEKLSIGIQTRYKIDGETRKIFGLCLQDTKEDRRGDELLKFACKHVEKIRLNPSLNNQYQSVKEIVNSNESFSPKITYLDVKSFMLQKKTVITEIEMIMIIDSLSAACSDLDEIKISGQSLSLGALSVISNFAIQHKALTLRLQNCIINDAHIKALTPFLASLHELDLSKNSNLPVSCMKLISTAIENSFLDVEKYNFQTLRLADCTVRDTHIEVLKPCIKYLKELDLSTNPMLLARSMKLIAESVAALSNDPGARHLQVLRLQDCLIQDVSIRNLRPSLKYLHEIDFSRNHNFPLSCLQLISKALIQAYEKGDRYNIKVLRFRGCSLTHKHVKSLQQCLNYLKEVDVDENPDITRIRKLIKSTY